jgi:hypothetical protein
MRIVLILGAALAVAAYLALYQGARCAVRGFRGSAADVFELAEAGCARQVELYAGSLTSYAPPLVRVAEAACRGGSLSALKAAVTSAADPRAVAAEAMAECVRCPTCCAWLKNEYGLDSEEAESHADACTLRALRRE